MLAFSSCLWQAQGVYPKASGAVTETLPWQPEHHSCSSGTWVGAYVDLSLKEQWCWGVEGGLPRKILNWAEAQRPKSNQNHRHRQTVGQVPSSAKASFFVTAAQLGYCEIVQMTSFFLGLVVSHTNVCLDREDWIDMGNNYSPTKPVILTINQNLEA